MKREIGPFACTVFLILTACSYDGTARLTSTGSSPVASDCDLPTRGALTFSQSGTTTKRMSPGDTTILKPVMDVGYVIEPLEMDCVRELTVIPKNGASEDDFVLSQLPDGAVQLALTETATPGGSFELQARYGSKARMRDAVYVYDKARWPLEGIWSQPRDLCVNGRIGELELSRGGFSVTWQPFESYKDYWGSYTFERDEGETAQGTLTLKTTGGNYLPFGKTDHSLKVKVEDDMLTMVDGNFGSNRGSGICNAPFRRRD